LSVTEDDGKYTSPSIETLEEHLVDRRVSRFEIKVHGWKQFVLHVRSDGTNAKIVASSITRDETLGILKAVTKVLGLRPSPAAVRARSVKALTSREHDAFIAHASEDKDVAGPLAEAFKAKGYRVWMDDLKLRVGGFSATEHRPGPCHLTIRRCDLEPRLLRKGVAAART
jgi:hypothetical protein